MSRLRRSPHRGSTAAVALAAATALLASGFQTGAATAASGDLASSEILASPRAGAAPAELSPAQHTALLKSATTASTTTAEALGLGAKEKLVVKDVIKDADGTVHTRYERTYAGLPVLGGDLVVHQGGNRRTVSEATTAEISVPSTTAEVKAPAAAKKALAVAAAAEADDAKVDGAPLLVVWAATGAPTLAWESVVTGLQHDDTPSELHVVTDATAGKTLFQFEAVRTGTGTGQFSGQVPLGTTQSGSTYQLADAGRGGQRTYDLNQGTSGTGTLYTDDDDVWGTGLQSNRQTAGVDVAFGASATWDYYKEVFGRNGIRNDGVGAYSRAHYGNSYVNAFWQDACFCMTYGDGASNTAPLTSLDVAAHEMTHGVTSATAGLTYSGESGGLNEATSDILAAGVEFYANLAADTPDYMVGEKINIRGNGTPLRYMDKPSQDGSSPDYWSSSLGGLDVHYSSGPANHFFYLLSEGSGAKTVNGVAYNSPTSDGLSVPGIGIENAEQIWFRALTIYMTSSTNYAGARVATLQAAADLFGAYSPTYITVANTWAAINVGRRLVDGVNLVSPGNQITGVGQTSALPVEAFTTNAGATLDFQATGLPDGLSIDSATGVISGTATATSTNTVALTVTDSTGASATVGFGWTVAHVYGSSTRVDIPDRGAAVESPISVTGREGSASSTTQVHVKIVHTWRGDLVVDLVGPSGTVYSLLRQNGGSADNVDQTFTVNASAETVNGTWKLRVQDLASTDTGYIENWTITP